MSGRTLLLVIDGLRPDCVTPDLMPNLCALADRGVFFSDSHAVLPTVTRCNSATLATGALPGRHGVPGNRFRSRTLGADLNAGDHRDLERLRPSRGGRILRAPTLADAVRAKGGHTAVLGTGTPGAALLQNPEAEANGDLLIHPAVCAGASRGEVEQRFGQIPDRAVPATDLTKYFVRVAVEHVLPEYEPELLVFWHTDPDHTQHAIGLGAPVAQDAHRFADANLGLLLKAAGDDALVAVVSDHGFVSNTGTVDVAARLDAAGLSVQAQVHALGGLVYFDHPDGELEARTVTALRSIPEVGGIFTRHEIDGTFPLTLVGHGGDDAPDLLYGLRWDAESGPHGVEGRAWSHPMKGAGNHGSFSPYEVRNACIIAGPGIRSGWRSDVPSGNADIAPTLAALMGLDWPNDRDGRVLAEALEGGAVPDVRSQTARSESSQHEQWAGVSEVAGVRYVDWVDDRPR